MGTRRRKRVLSGAGNEFRARATWHLCNVRCVRESGLVVQVDCGETGSTESGTLALGRSRMAPRKVYVPGINTVF